MSRFDDENAKDIRESLRVYVYIEPIAGVPYSKRFFGRESIIKAELSLRSDLSPINPTLPASEISLELLMPYDISDNVAALPEGQGIEVYFNYPKSDTAAAIYSIRRYFYTDGPMRWDKGVLYIHAVDQVNKLDGKLSSIFLGQYWFGNALNQSYYGGFGYLYSVFRDILTGEAQASDAGKITNRIKHLSAATAMMNVILIEHVDGHYSTLPANGCVNSIIESATRREMIALLMNLCHQEYPAGFYQNQGSYFNDAFWITYVDAGSPRISLGKPVSKYTIYEEDCGDIQTDEERRVSQYRFKVRDVERCYANGVQGMDAVSGTIFKQKGVALDYSGYADTLSVGVRGNEALGNAIVGIYEIEDGAANYDTGYPERARPYNPSDWDNYPDHRARFFYGKWLLDDALEESDWRIGKYSYYDLSDKWNVPDHYGESAAMNWDWLVENGAITAAATDAPLSNVGYYFVMTNEREIVINTGEDGIVIAPEEVAWNGHILAKSWYSDKAIQVLPDYGLRSITKRSRKVGSFTWKGHPDMQPRDVFTFVYKEDALLTRSAVQLTDENGEDILIGGNSEVRTVESITLTYEKGGLIAEITWRAGIC